jgi:hypothetical protein
LGSREYGNDLPDSLKGEVFLDQLSDYQFLEVCAPWNLLHLNGRERGVEQGDTETLPVLHSGFGKNTPDVCRVSFK